jgi:hypothetical protein
MVREREKLFSKACTTFSSIYHKVLKRMHKRIASSKVGMRKINGKKVLLPSCLHKNSGVCY